MTRFAKDSRLIIDLGMNNGDDTAFYLSRGFSVVALDANPALCERAQARFCAATDSGRLKILNAAIWEKNGHASFYVNLDNDHWSSLDVGWAGRDATKYKEIVVQCVTLGSLFAEFGLPYTIVGFNLNTADAWAAGEGNLSGTWPTVWHHDLDVPGSKTFVANFIKKNGKRGKVCR